MYPLRRKVAFSWASGDRVVSVEVTPDFHLAVFGYRTGPHSVIEHEVDDLSEAIELLVGLL